MKPEQNIQMQIVEVFSILSLRYPFMYFSVPNESFLLALSGRKRLSGRESALLTNLKKMGLTPGASDLMVLSRGRAYCMEVKAPGGTLSENQKRFHAWCERCGIPYIVVRSAEEAVEALKFWGIVSRTEIHAGRK